MNQKKIGSFLKELRKGKGMTQEQLGEVLGVSGRTVSRWETGFNMPDLSILIQIADYYDVEIREILDGERRNEDMDKEMKETLSKAADYSNLEKQQLTRRMCILFITGTITATIYIFLEFFLELSTPALDFVKGMALGYSYGMLVGGILFTSGVMYKLNAGKKKLLTKLSH